MNPTNLSDLTDLRSEFRETSIVGGATSTTNYYNLHMWHMEMVYINHIKVRSLESLPTCMLYPNFAKINSYLL